MIKIFFKNVYSHLERNPTFSILQYEIHTLESMRCDLFFVMTKNLDTAYTVDETTIPV